MQHAAGNRAVTALLGAVQAKIEVGAVDDPLEAAADAVAQGVVQSVLGTSPPGTGPRRVPVPSGSAPGAQRTAQVGAAGGLLDAGMEGLLRSARHGGVALDPVLQRTLGEMMGVDLSAVRLHDGPIARDLTSRMQASAFTVGGDVFFRDGLPDPARPAGLRLLAHELAHTVQQGASTRSPATAVVHTKDLNADAGTESVTAGLQLLMPGTGVGADPLQRQHSNRSGVRRLGSGPIGRAAADYVSDSAQLVVQRNGESAQLLKSMAVPQVRAGPVIELQKELVGLLEGGIRQQNAKKGEGYNQDNLFLGGIEIATIPSEEEGGDARLMEISRLVRMKVNSLGRDDFSLVEDIDSERTENGSVKKMIVENTLRTMIDAKQIDYLRKSGFVGKGWKLLIEVHYYRRRSKISHQMHKDTLGQTLFVNLNYHIDQTIGGPEYIVNPPAVAEHDEFTTRGGKLHGKDESLTGGGLPPEFLKDMAAARQGLTKDQEGTDLTVGAPDVPAYGYVAFVDELIHHNTPLLGGRQVSGGALDLYLKKNDVFKNEYEQAKEAYERYKKRSWLAVAYGFDSYLPNSLTKPTMWNKLIPMLHGPGTTFLDKFERRKLQEVGMPVEEIDKLLDQYSTEFTKVSLPTVSRGTPQALGIDGGGKRLTRTMSSRALANNLPADTPGDRTFFRTWVRAVKAQ